MSDTPCMDIPLEDFDVSEDCRNILKRVGITRVGEVVEMLGSLPYRMDGPRGLREKHIDEMITQLKAMDCWPDDMPLY